MPSYTLPIEDLLQLTLSEVEERINRAEKACVGHLTLRDLAGHPSHPNGVYIFFREGTSNPFYIGRASSRSFIGRLPSHFEPHANYWMNGLAKGMQAVDACTYQDGINAALGCNLLLIGFPHQEGEEGYLLRKQRINMLELVLQRYLGPTLTSRRSIYTGQEVLASLLPTQVPQNSSIKTLSGLRSSNTSQVKR